jgi:hypothetical protein
MIAACRLQALIDSRAGQPDIAKIRVQVEQHPESPDVEADALDEADDAYDPIEFAMRTTSFDLRPSRLPPPGRCTPTPERGDAQSQ